MMDPEDEEESSSEPAAASSSAGPPPGTGTAKKRKHRSKPFGMILLTFCKQLSTQDYRFVIGFISLGYYYYSGVIQSF